MSRIYMPSDYNNYTCKCAMYLSMAIYRFPSYSCWQFCDAMLMILQGTKKMRIDLFLHNMKIDATLSCFHTLSHNPHLSNGTINLVRFAPRGKEISSWSNHMKPYERWRGIGFMVKNRLIRFGTFPFSLF